MMNIIDKNEIIELNLARIITYYEKKHEDRLKILPLDLIKAKGNIRKITKKLTELGYHNKLLDADIDMREFDKFVSDLIEDWIYEYYNPND
jgi:hypothetical protein